MEHFVRIVMEKQDSLIEGLNEDVFPNHEIYETEQDATVIEIPLPQALSEDVIDEFVNRLADHMFNEGYEDFDIEVSTDSEEELDEITLDGDDFYEEFGVMWFNEDDELDEAEYRGRKVKLGKPMRGDVKKFKVYVKNPKGNVVKVNFGDPDMKIKKSNPARRRSFRARHNCDNPGPRHKARYWSCRKW
jgi:hypothetical protein